MLTRKRSVWCFLFVTLFNLQGTRRFRRNIAIVHHFISFVKNFFQKFLTPDPFCISSNFLSLPHSGSFVKNFFLEVLNFRFPVICGNLFRLPHLVAAVKWSFLPTLWRSLHRADSFVRIPNKPWKVNPTLHYLFTFSISPPKVALIGLFSCSLVNSHIIGISCSY